MPRPTVEAEPLLFTDNTPWLEETDGRRSEGPEEMLTRLEGLLETGEATQDDIIQYLKDYNS